MTEQSKFSGALAKLNQRHISAPVIEPTPHQLKIQKIKGRPPGKRSDPDYQATTVLLRKETKKTATRRLEDNENGKDLSDLIEELLSEWVRQSL